MFRIILLLCYSLIDTNTIPFYFSLSQIGRVESHTQRFGLTVSFRRFPPHSTSPIPQGTFSTFGLTLSHGQNSLKPQLLQVVIRTQHGVFAGLKRFSEPFEELTAFYQQAHTLSGSLLPYRFVVNSLLYDSYPMGGASTSTSLLCSSYK